MIDKLLMNQTQRINYYFLQYLHHSVDLIVVVNYLILPGNSNLINSYLGPQFCSTLRPPPVMTIKRFNDSTNNYD